MITGITCEVKAFSRGEIEVAQRLVMRNLHETSTQRAR